MSPGLDSPCEKGTVIFFAAESAILCFKILTTKKMTVLLCRRSGEERWDQERWDREWWDRRLAGLEKAQTGETPVPLHLQGFDRPGMSLFAHVIRGLTRV